MKIEAEIKKVGAVTPTTQNIKQTKSYFQTFKESKKNLSEFIGLVLLCLVAGQAEPSDWQILEHLLRQLYTRGAL
jgi:hypothetical protein